MTPSTPYLFGYVAGYIIGGIVFIFLISVAIEWVIEKFTKINYKLLTFISTFMTFIILALGNPNNSGKLFISAFLVYTVRIARYNYK